MLLKLLFAILIYIISVISFSLIVYYSDKSSFYTIGDVLDELDPSMYVPLINTLLLIGFILAYIIIYSIYLLRIEIFFKKIKNIKLK